MKDNKIVYEYVQEGEKYRKYIPLEEEEFKKLLKNDDFAEIVKNILAKIFENEDMYLKDFILYYDEEEG